MVAESDGTDALSTAAAAARTAWQVFRGGAGSQIAKLVAGGSAEGAGGGPVGVLVGIGTAAIGGIVDARLKYNAAVDDLEASSAAEIAAEAKMYAALRAWATAARPSLAGRYTDRDRRPGQPGNGDKDCDQQWENARAYCADLLAMPRNSPEWKKYHELWGGNYNRCVKGQVDEKCGGSHIEY